MNFDPALLRPAVHLLLHVLVPLGVALVFHRAQWRSASKPGSESNLALLDAQ